MSGPPEALPSIALLYTTFKIVLYYTYFLFDSRGASTTMVHRVSQKTLFFNFAIRFGPELPNGV